MSYSTDEREALNSVKHYFDLPAETLEAVNSVKDEPGASKVISEIVDIFLWNVRIPARTPKVLTPERMLVKRLNALPTVFTPGISEYKAPSFDRVLSSVWDSELANLGDDFLEMEAEQLEIISAFSKLYVALARVNRNFSSKDTNDSVLASLAKDYHAFVNGMVEAIEEHQFRSAVELHRFIESGEYHD